MNGIDCGRGAKIGKSLALPHPVNIVIGMGVEVGDCVTIYQGVTLGQVNGRYPVIESDVVIFPNSVVCGAITVPFQSKVQALSLLVPKPESSPKNKAQIESGLK